MENFLNRAVDIEIDGKPFKMLYTTKAYNESKQYLEALIRDNDDETDEDYAFDTLNATAGLVSCLCNGWIEYKNQKNDEKEELISPDYVLINTMPNELAELTVKAHEAMKKGAKTFVQSSEAKKN